MFSVNNLGRFRVRKSQKYNTGHTIKSKKANAQIVGVEYVGAKQFGLGTVVEILCARVREAFGFELAEEKFEAFAQLIQSANAEQNS